MVEVEHFINEEVQNGGILVGVSIGKNVFLNPILVMKDDFFDWVKENPLKKKGKHTRILFIILIKIVCLQFKNNSFNNTFFVF